ncbi:hypothetical protein GQ44DRAFT_769536 [Phaeosphaeriaceae sp. PMI808]|nr:hypothetical protein GQ44DRAFT_769536 [Phaeosphaeriaceae sp. PMI808]
MRDITPDRLPKKHSETTKKLRFFEAFDQKDLGGRMPARQLFQNFKISKTTAYRWLNERQEHGRMAYRRYDLRNLKSQKAHTPSSGRPRKLSDALLNKIIHAPKKTQRKCLITQAKKKGISASRTTITKALIERKRATPLVRR